MTADMSFQNTISRLFTEPFHSIYCISLIYFILHFNCLFNITTFFIAENFLDKHSILHKRHIGLSYIAFYLQFFNYIIDFKAENSFTFYFSQHFSYL